MERYNNPLAIEPSRGEIDSIEKPLVIEFGTDWCGYCIAAQSLIASALFLHPQIRHIRIEDGPGRRLGRSFRVKLWPTLIFVRQGQEVERLVRPADARIIEQALGRIAQGAE